MKIARALQWKEDFRGVVGTASAQAWEEHQRSEIYVVYPYVGLVSADISLPGGD